MIQKNSHEFKKEFLKESENSNTFEGYSGMLPINSKPMITSKVIK